MSHDVTKSVRKIIDRLRLKLQEISPNPIEFSIDSLERMYQHD